jgi:hypothetical protein
MRVAAGVSGEFDHRSKLLAVPYFRPITTTETRAYIGETATSAFDGMAGFRIGQPYQLSYNKGFNEVRITLAHGSAGAGPLVVMNAQLEK